MKNLLFIIFAGFFIACFLFSCANQKPPTGGPRDTIPPQLVVAYPVIGATNFKGNEIILTYNEFVQIKRINTDLIITPTIDSKFKAVANKRSVTVSFEDDTPFEENTTYTFNFQETIQDITEGNPAEVRRMVFSTGPYLDSLAVSGVVEFALTSKLAEEIVVALYPAEDTLNVFEDIPMYFTRTNEAGLFSLENIKNGKFNLYAFQDKNKNLKLDSKSEPYGFLPDTLFLDTTITGLEIPLISLNIEPIRIITAFPSSHYFEVNFNKFINDFNFETLSFERNLFANITAEKNKIRFYNTYNLNNDSIQIYLNAVDSVNNLVYDTMYVKFDRTTRQKEQFTYNIYPTGNSEISENYNAVFNFNKPVKTLNYDSIYFIIDSLNIIPVSADDSLVWSDHRDKLLLYKYLDKNSIFPDTTSKNDQLVPGQNMKVKKENFIFHIGRGTFISADNDSSSSKSLNYSFKTPDKYGTIKGSVETEFNSYIIQLLDRQFNIVQETFNQRDFTFTMVPPGNYRIRILVDLNKNGKWDPGNILMNIPPEPVVFYEEESTEGIINLKANWEMIDYLITF
jgi:uncharacterized protein (DUF2141 family)